MQTSLCRVLAIDHPVLNAPMGLVAGGRLAAAVSDSGGLGMIGGALRGREGLRSEIRAARDLTDRRVGVGFISHLAETEELVATALDDGITVIAHSFADPPPPVGPAHDAGAMVLCQVRTVGEATRAAEAGADVIVAQGTEAGGHTGYVSTLPLVPAVVDAVAPLPVIAAGGIGDARTIAAALVLGADGVWMGTRFEATPESDLRGGARERIARAGADDTVLTTTYDLAIKMDWPHGVAMRALRSPFFDRWHGHEQELGGWTEEDADRHLAEGFATPEDAMVLAGQGVGLVHETEPAGEVVRRLVREAEELLRQRPRSLVE